MEQNNNSQEETLANENEVFETAAETGLTAEAAASLESMGAVIAKNPKHETQNRKKWLLIGTGVLGVLVIAAVALGLIFPNLFTGKGPVLATVDKDKIYVNDFQERVRYYRWQFLQQYAQIAQIMSFMGDYDGNQQYQLDQINGLLTDKEYFGTIVLNTMIDELILEREAEEMGIKISDEDIDKSIREAFGYDLDAEFAPVEDPLNAQPTQTVDEKLAAFQADYDTFLGRLAVAEVSEAEFRDIVKVNLLHNAVFEEVTKDYVPGTQDMVLVRHILVEDQETALSIIEQLNDGSKTFEELAGELSLDTASAVNGGMLDWFGPGMMIEEFENAAYALDIDEISPPIPTYYGYHILQLVDREERPISEEQQSSEKSNLFAAWMDERNAVIEADLVIDKELLVASVPTEPSFDDPLVYETIFGAPPEGQDAGTDE